MSNVELTQNALAINEVHEGDCLELMKRIPDDSVDLIITSPPYADRRKNTYGGVHADNYVEWFLPIAKEYMRILKPSGSLFINIKPHCDKGERVLYVFELVIALKREVGFRFTDEFTWTKNGVPGKFKGRFKNGFEPVYHFTKSADYTFNPYDVATEMKEDSIKRAQRKACGETSNGSGFAGMREGSSLSTAKLALPSNHLHIPQKSNQYTIQSKHPAVFPIELPEFFIKAYSNQDDIVLDNFLGSGTTAVAAINTNRNFIGIEREPDYVAIANQRIADALKAKEQSE